MIYDVIVIGAGITGGFIARELSKYSLNVCILEKGSDIAMGASKANSGIIHSGYDTKEGTLKALLNIKGKKSMRKVCQELDVPFKENGSLVIAYKENEMTVLEELLARGEKNGIEHLKILNRDEILKIEPNIADNVFAALFAPDAATVCPYELTIASVENAVDNGVVLFRDSEVIDITCYNDIFRVKTVSNEFQTKYIANAAGVYSDKVARMIGDEGFNIKPRKGEYVLYDKSYGNIVNSVIFQLPTKKGKGVLIATSVHGNLLVGPNANYIEDKEDTTTTRTGYEEIVQSAKKVLADALPKDPIATFSGIRASSKTGDFIIKPSDKNNRFINVAGIESPGLSAAPAIGRYVVDILIDQGLKTIINEKYDPVRKKVIRTRHLEITELNEIIKNDPAFGNIICRCEKVSEGEVIDSIRRGAGARDMDGVKRRTRSGMGRCQGGFCGPLVLKILARELDVPIEEITKKGGKSNILVGKTK